MNKKSIMQQQYWVTKKSVLRKLGGKEDECIVSSDAELDAKLELFKSVNDSCIQLQRIIDLYQEKLCYLAQEENALGRYLKECSKKEKNQFAAQIMSTAGKALAYTGHQRLSVRPPLVRLHHEVDTFRGRGVSDTRVTVSEMEKVRTEYRAALSWMKSASAQLDPDTGHGLERFRKAQSYVKTAKTKFDRFTLACLQKVDLLAAARCNMFSHALVPYQNGVSVFSKKASETLSLASAKLNNIPAQDYSGMPLTGLSTEPDKDRDLFFNADYTDKPDSQAEPKTTTSPEEEQPSANISNLLGEDFTRAEASDESQAKSDLNPDLCDLNWSTNSDFLGGEFMPSKLLQAGPHNFYESQQSKENGEAKASEVKDVKKSGTSWLSLFDELDPLANTNEAMGNNKDDRA